jgi:hypothetical protein
MKTSAATDSKRPWSFRTRLESRVLVDHQGNVGDVTLPEDVVQSGGDVAILLEIRFCRPS